MNAREQRAEKIIRMCDTEGTEMIDLIESVAAAIREAEREALSNELKTKCFCLVPRTYISVRCRGCHALIYAECGFDDFKKGFSAAREQAAKIASDIGEDWNKSCEFDKGAVATYVARHIRAMKPDGEDV